MISDVLFEAEESINAYLESDATRHCYQDREVLAEISDVLERMRSLRRKLDNPLGFTDPLAASPPAPEPANP